MNKEEFNMNIYEKLQDMRVNLQEMELKKSGRNKFAGYDYFELVDFLPAVTKLMLQKKVASSLSFAESIVTLTLINIEEPTETIIFTSPMASAALKGCHDIQNLGAVITYLRRYLYINAFDIVENDVLNATSNQETHQPQTKVVPQDSRILDIIAKIDEQSDVQVAQKIAANAVQTFKTKEDQNAIWKAFYALRKKLTPYSAKEN